MDHSPKTVLASDLQGKHQTRKWFINTGRIDTMIFEGKTGPSVTSAMAEETSTGERFELESSKFQQPAVRQAPVEKCRSSRSSSNHCNQSKECYRVNDNLRRMITRV
jgi:hypothetical protein